MRIRNLWAVATLCGGIAAFSAAQAQTAIQVTNWPGDVPCSALQLNLDGSYTLTQAVIVGNDTSYPMGAGNIFPTNGEYQVWKTKCGG
jgi:hypothetical protein